MDFSLTEEQQMFQKTLHEWVEREAPKSLARQWEADEFTYPEDLWEKMSSFGLHAIGIPEEFGGQGGDVVTQVIVARELARSLGGLTWVWGIPSFCAKAVAAFSPDEVRYELLPDLANGRARMAISVTEPSGGTDLLGAMTTVAEPVDGGWRVRGQKIWSSGAHAATHLLLLARTDKQAARPAQGVTAFLVPNPSEGLTIRQIPKLGMRGFGSCEVFLDDVVVPDRFVVGEVGRGWYQMLTTLNNERILVAATCTGIIDGVLEDAVAYLKQREAFGKTIGHFQSLQHYVADIAIWQREAELLTYLAAWRQQRNEPCGTESNMAKIVASEYAGQAADLGIQILGGMGYAAETDMQRYWRDARLYRIGPITNEMARNLVAESFGLPRSF
ncbi:MAG TPA: acyl-CoA dehydrogenase family protein [Acidimicrobiales bacterium]|nr:acyl-CoA dehydrogenase family protein [Acidimicrobiales bacterium]